ncbi:MULTISPECIES: siphovirus Gp157 family protein [unclassified Staphylococcus]|uniref:siphovirus Gp157 family protein n=1 Tax=unclassified Staphylococcus TaxID=91994 RepID=UPI0021CE038F|nr:MULTISPECIES: siphovirus Gp157 family protein [unclassified Staphylococcus]UXR72331.1 siphovirus Gp157 family protein [Staphylococcus sp. IVB6240]UXR75630.1 siphovirus Gp157 family protein [Staphylococcus sp. IVB6233]UXR79029.1 siphovirus Gp157 family protein [Staphylococcus sp. IVB6227]UXR79830.1 siphovirus Gp157 family protein [Staphylococcus sp. IVB6218]
MSNLFEINERYLQVLDMWDDVEPGIIQDTLDSIEAETHEKVDNIIGLKRSVDGDVGVIDAEIKRLQKMKKQKANLSDRLKSYLEVMLEQRGLKKYKTPTNHIYKRKNAPSVIITNESLIDKAYYIPQPPKLNKTQIKEDIKAGADVEGAELQASESLVIK